MNDTLHNLALQAGFRYIPSEKIEWNDDGALEKFAELIVLECVAVSESTSHRKDDMGYLIGRRILKHFEMENSNESD
jgi:hypothetical protein